MKYILTSSNVELRNMFNSESFISSNYDTQFNDETVSSTLRLSKEPVVGDYLYFISNYYEQIPVKVVRLVYSNTNTCLVWCELANMWDIDPFIYANPSDWYSKYTSDFTDLIIRTYNRLKKHIPTYIQDAKNLYGETSSNELDELGIVTVKIIEYTGIDNNTCVDYMNLIYAVNEILSKNFPSKYTWTKPEKDDFCDY